MISIAYIGSVACTFVPC